MKKYIILLAVVVITLPATFAHAEHKDFRTYEHSYINDNHKKRGATYHIKDVKSFPKNKVVNISKKKDIHDNMSSMKYKLPEGVFVTFFQNHSYDDPNSLGGYFTISGSGIINDFEKIGFGDCISSWKWYTGKSLGTKKPEPGAFWPACKGEYKPKKEKTVRPTFTVEQGLFSVNIPGAIELLSIEVIITNWKEPAFSYIDIWQPSREVVRIERKDYPSEPRDNISSKYTFKLNESSPFSSKYINGTWKISVPGYYGSMTVSLIVNKRN
jgi:hypothetical protein